MASSVGAGSEGGGEKGKGSGEGESRRLSRQHAKDISDYTKQILAKDRELDSLRKKLSKVSFLEFQLQCTQCTYTLSVSMYMYVYWVCMQRCINRAG